MRNYFLTIALTFIVVTHANSQTWVTHGAVWHYDFSDFLDGGGFIRIEYTGDTIISGKACQQLVPIRYFFTIGGNGQAYLQSIITLPPEFTYVNDDTVFHFKHSEWYMLYDFGAQVGETWLVDTADCPSYVIVDSTGIMNINNADYRFITLELTPGSLSGISGRVIERFGPIDYDYLFPTEKMSCDSNWVIEWPIYSFTCFSDDSFALYNATQHTCEYLLGIPPIPGNSDLFSISIFPNPATDQLNISFGNLEIENLEIANQLGQIVYSQNLTTQYPIPNTQIDVSALPAGVYLLTASAGGGKVTKMLVKQ